MFQYLYLYYLFLYFFTFHHDPSQYLYNCPHPSSFYGGLMVTSPNEASLLFNFQPSFKVTYLVFKFLERMENSKMVFYHLFSHRIHCCLLPYYSWLYHSKDLSILNHYHEVLYYQLTHFNLYISFKCLSI